MELASPPPYGDATEHLLEELHWLGMLVMREVVRFRAAQPDPADGGQGVYIGEAEIDRLLADLLGHARPEDTDAGRLTAQADAVRIQIDARLAACAASGVALPVERVERRFGLTGFDRTALLLAAAPDLDRRFEKLCAYLLDDVTKRRPTTGLALMLGAPRLSHQWKLRRRLEPGAPLLVERLVDVEGDGPFLSRPLRVDDRLLDELLGDAPVDRRLLPTTELIDSPRRLWHLSSSAALDEQIEALGRLWRAHPGTAPRGPQVPFHPVAVLEAGKDSGLEAVGLAIAERLGRPVLRVRVDRLLASQLDLTEAISVLRREALLRDGLLLLENCQELASPEARAREAWLEFEPLLHDAPTPIVLVTPRAAEIQRAFQEVPFLRLELPPSSVAERRRLWTEALEREGLRLETADVAQVATTFVLTPGMIERAAAGAGHRASLRNGGRTVVSADLNAAARAQSHHGLDALARRIDPIYSWDDIVLPPATAQQLREISAAAGLRSIVLSDWGLGRKLSRGRGLNVLFSGASGTGKTMSAEVIALDLGLDLFQIDLATVVSKYIGETEKNLKRIFDEAETSNAILFFDEADALFGKRSEVRDSHDRYANIEIAYLLQLMEQYEGGMAILATNLSQNLDEAFARRMQYRLEYPLPDAGLREQIWVRMFPPEAPVGEDVDLGYLARQFELAGGSIRGAALAAATMAAADGGVIRMSHLTLAVAREYQKLGRLPSHGEFGPWYAEVLSRLSGKP